MARSHSYFSFTLLCICAGMRKVPEPRGSLAASGSSPIPQTCHSPFSFSFFRCIGSCGTEAPPPSGCCHCSQCHAKHVRRQARARTRAHTQNASHSHHTVRRQMLFFLSLSLFFLILHTFDSSEYSCGIFYRVAERLKIPLVLMADDGSRSR